MKIRPFSMLALLTALASPAFAQPTVHAHETAAAAASADAKAFAQLKTLAGSWAGRLTTTPDVHDVAGSFVQFSLRVTSRGNALVHEMSVAGLPDHPLTMFYVDGDRLTATHYCDAGNRPRLVGTVSPDGRTLAFEFLDLSGDNAHGHMHRGVLTFIDDNHHTEDWTFMMPGDKPMVAHFDLHRTNFEPATR